MTNSRYNAHTEPLFKQLHLLKVKDIFNVQCLKFWYTFVNKNFQNISKTCLDIIMRFTKSEPEAMMVFTYTQPAQVMLTMFWDIIYWDY